LEIFVSEIKTQRRMVAILRVLSEAGAPLGSERIAEELRLSGIDLSERTVRNYLSEADRAGWTRNLGRRGRELTPDGVREVGSALVIDKVGFVAARVDELAYRMTFDLTSRRGEVIVNVSTLALQDLSPAIEAMNKVYAANLGMGRLVALGAPGTMLGDFRVPNGRFAIGTVCSVSINGVFLRASIATTSRFGGLLEIERGQPKRFTQIINYDGSSVDPLEVFIRGHMTSVARAAQTGSGAIGASFREVPVVALPDVRRLAALSERVGIGGVLAVGRPNQPLLGIPVAQGRAGLIVCGGLNPVAAVVEAGIATTSTAMKTLCDFASFVDYAALPSLVPAGARSATARA
jgi:repressor of nif and glnA expression